MDNPAHEQLTPCGRGAVTTFVVEGPADWLDRPSPTPVFRAANRVAIACQPLGAVIFGHLALPGEDAEEVVVCRTAHHRLELHCHGGEAATRRVAGVLNDAGFLLRTRPSNPSRPTSDLPPPTPQRVNSSCPANDSNIDSSQAAGPVVVETRQQRLHRLRDLVTRAATFRTAAVAHAQYRGAFPREIVELLEHDLPGPRAIERLRQLVALAALGRHLVEPFRVGVVGRPNVGKSSLINALLGFERSIVLDRPGTTRDVLTAETACAGWPIRLADTAGFRTEAGALERQGMERARDWLVSADLVLLVLDGSQPLDPEDHSLRREFADALTVITKGDLAANWDPALVPGGWVVSSRTGQGFTQLMSAMTNRLVPQTPRPGGGIPTSEEEVASLRAALAECEHGRWSQARAWLRPWTALAESGFSGPQTT